MTDPANPLGMKSISDKSISNPVENYVSNIKNTFKYDWVFDKWYEKIILLGFSTWAMFCIVRFLLEL